MPIRSSTTMMVVAIAVSSLAGCVAGNEDEDVAEATAALTVEPHLTYPATHSPYASYNELAAAGGGAAATPCIFCHPEKEKPKRIVATSVPPASTSRPLSAQASAQGVDEEFRDVVECALTRQQTVTRTVDGAPHTYVGALGFASGWADGTCGEDCQRRVSACLLSRDTRSGHYPSIHIVGGVWAAATGFSQRESGVLGNLWAAVPTATLCTGGAAAVSAGVADGRTCASNPAACGMQSVGSCASLACQAGSDGTDYCTIGGSSWPVLWVDLLDP